VRTASAGRTVALDSLEAAELWKDVRRWPTFVEGFARALELSPEWPGSGAKLVWESTPGGRGRVTERVVESGERRFATELYEESLRGRQTAVFAPAAEGTRIEVRLDYELTRYGPLRAVADVVFIRRALRDALRRTLRRFAVEAEEEATLR
jgi:polyketide cyclase/dehydrase/lipid transport protein